eukprot:10316517-Prorocentrum_lima.AAC.1
MACGQPLSKLAWAELCCGRRHLREDACSGAPQQPGLLCSEMPLHHTRGWPSRRVGFASSAIAAR